MVPVADGASASKSSSVLSASVSDGFHRINSYTMQVSLNLSCEYILTSYLGFNAVDCRQCPTIGCKIIGSILSPVVSIQGKV